MKCTLLEMNNKGMNCNYGRAWCLSGWLDRSCMWRDPVLPFPYLSKLTGFIILCSVNHLDSIKSTGSERRTVLHGSFLFVWLRTSLPSKELHSTQFILSAVRLTLTHQTLTVPRMEDRWRIDQIAAGGWFSSPLFFFSLHSQCLVSAHF